MTIRWYAVPNANEKAGGWLPVYDEGGKQRGHTYWSRGYDLETALAMAKAEAEQHAEKYVGDWEIDVGPKPGAPGVPKVPRAKKPPARRSPYGEVDTPSDQLPWRSSYANWTIRVGEAAAKHGATISFGSETHDAWKAGVSPDAYAKARAKAKR